MPQAPSNLTPISLPQLLTTHHALQPPKEVIDPVVYLRLKHGIVTVFVTAESTEPFSKVTDELLQTLRERYPDGLKTSTGGPETTAVPPAGADIRVSYAVLKNPRDQESGWKDLKVTGDETPASKGLKDNTIVAFALSEGDVDEPSFQVEFPSMDDVEQ